MGKEPVLFLELENFRDFTGKGSYLRSKKGCQSWLPLSPFLDISHKDLIIMILGTITDE